MNSSSPDKAARSPEAKIGSASRIAVRMQLKKTSSGSSIGRMAPRD
jgi:hypothetical protein